MLTAGPQYPESSHNVSVQVKRFSGRALAPRATSIRLNTCRADDASPFRKLALDQSRKLVRRCCEPFEAKSNQPRLYARQCDGAGDLVMKQRNDVPWHAGWHQNYD